MPARGARFYKILRGPSWLSTALVIGYKVEKVNGRELVNFVWCKVCARNKDALLTHPNCKGTVKKSVNAYVDGTNYVTKHNVTRHLEGESHRIALSIEKSKPVAERVGVEHCSGSGVRSLQSKYIYFHSFHILKKLENMEIS